MSLEKPTTAPGVNPLVRWFLVGLPLGLLLMGALSFVIYFQKRHAKAVAAAAPSRYAAMLRQDLNLAEYRRYIRIFDQEIGPRTTGNAENIEAAQSFIESTLGFGNTGYQVLRRESGASGNSSVTIEVELKGKTSPEYLHLVTARYDSESARDIAALLCLAKAFTGTAHSETIRFVAWSGGAESVDQFDLERYRQGLPEGTATSLELLQVHGPEGGDEALNGLKLIEKAIKTAADGSAGH